MIAEACITIRGMRRFAIVLLLSPALAFAWSSGSGTCDAVADGSFMGWKTHHAGQSGAFLIEFSPAAYLPGEALTVTLRHSSDQQFVGFLIYAEGSGGVRQGVFTPQAAITSSGNLPGVCAFAGHTVTHTAPDLRATQSLQWTPPASATQPFQFRALILRGDPMSQSGTDFYEVSATLEPGFVVFRDGFESP